MNGNLFSLADKVAIVTGAGSGIGRAAAQLLSELGARVVATDINLAAVTEASATFVNPGLALKHDVTSEADWQAVQHRTMEAFGRLDILVNNAGIMLEGLFETFPMEEFRRQNRVNVESVFIGMQTSIPNLRASIAKNGGAASIINISSIYGQVAGEKFSAYSATKGAVCSLSKAVANELAASGIRVNAILPGGVATNLTANWDPPRDASGRIIPPAERLAAFERLVPMRRLGVASDIVGAIAFFASEASRYVTGTELIVDGGYTAI